MEKTELEKREKELKKVSLYERLSNEVSIDKQKEEIKEKIKTAVATNDFEEMSRFVKVIDNLSKQDNQQQKEIGDLRIREIKKVLSSIISLIPESGIDVIVGGIRFKTKSENRKPIQSESGITIEKNKTVTKVSAVESFTAKVQRLSGLHPDIHVTHSDLSYPKAAKAWLTKNFPEELAIS